MAKRKKTNNEINLDDFVFGEEPKKIETVEIETSQEIEEELIKPVVKELVKENNSSKKKPLNLTPYLVKNEIVLKHIHIGSVTKKKLIKASKILEINQYDLATNILEIFFKKYGLTIKNLEEDIL